MPAPVTFNAIISGIKAVIDAVPNSGQCDLVPGGPSPWSKGGGPQFHWWLDVVGTDQRITTIPGSARQMASRQDTRIVVEAWYPADPDHGSSETWRNTLDAVIRALERKATLGLGLIPDVTPVILKDDFALKTSLSKNDLPTACHYAKIALTYQDEYEFVTVVG